MAAPDFANNIRSYFAERIPTADSSGTVPNWSTVGPLIAAHWKDGRPVTYIDGSGYQYICGAITSSVLRLYGRLVPNYPSSGSARLYWIEINRSSGAVTAKTTTFTGTTTT